MHFVSEYLENVAMLWKLPTIQLCWSNMPGDKARMSLYCSEYLFYHILE